MIALHFSIATCVDACVGHLFVFCGELFIFHVAFAVVAQEAAQDSSTNAPFARMSQMDALRAMQMMMAGTSNHYI